MKSRISRHHLRWNPIMTSSDAELPVPWPACSRSTATEALLRKLHHGKSTASTRRSPHHPAAKMVPGRRSMIVEPTMHITWRISVTWVLGVRDVACRWAPAGRGETCTNSSRTVGSAASSAANCFHVQRIWRDICVVTRASDRSPVWFVTDASASLPTCSDIFVKSTEPRYNLSFPFCSYVWSRCLSV